MSNVKGWEIIIVLALLLLLFGAKRLPDAARGLGRSLRIFKAETKGLREDEPTEAAPRQSLPPVQQNNQQGPQVAPPLEHDARRDSA